MEGHADTAALLLQHSAALNLQANAGNTPLHSTCYLNHMAVISLLLQQPRLLPSLADNDGDSPLTAACIMGHYNAVRQLLDHPHLAWPSPAETAACPHAARALLQQRLAARARPCARCGRTADAATVTPFATALSCPVSRLCVCPGPKPGQNGPPAAVYCSVKCQRRTWKEWKKEHPRLSEAGLLELSELRAALLAAVPRPKP
jgi:ankyrin repeat protein